MKWLYRIIMSELTPSFLKGTSEFEKRHSKFWMEVFSHFMEEINRRGMDIKIFQDISKDLGKEIEERFSNRET
jgi:hypothetical protein